MSLSYDQRTEHFRTTKNLSGSLSVDISIYNCKQEDKRSPGSDRLSGSTGAFGNEQDEGNMGYEVGKVRPFGENEVFQQIEYSFNGDVKEELEEFRENHQDFYDYDAVPVVGTFGDRIEMTLHVDIDDMVEAKCLAERLLKDIEAEIGFRR